MSLFVIAEKTVDIAEEGEDPNDFYVVGNIYENPELLSKK